jgi:hypothetical protein
MPIPVLLADLTGTPGIRGGLLRPLFLSRATETTDPTDGSTGITWTTSEFLGRITRGQSTEVGDDGRQAAVDTIKLLTNTAGIESEDRIVEQTLDQSVWQVDGHPVAVWGASAIHHYEVPLRRVDG